MLFWNSDLFLIFLLSFQNLARILFSSFFSCWRSWPGHHTWIYGGNGSFWELSSRCPEFPSGPANDRPSSFSFSANARGAKKDFLGNGGRALEPTVSKSLVCYHRRDGNNRFDQRGALGRRRPKTQRLWS